MAYFLPQAFPSISELISEYCRVAFCLLFLLIEAIFELKKQYCYVHFFHEMFENSIIAAMYF